MLTWRVPRVWSGTAFIVGGGPSVADQPTERLRDRQTIAINSSWERVPFAPFLFFTDLNWFRHHEARLQGFAGEIVSCSPCPGLVGRTPHYLKRRDLSVGLSTDPDSVVVGATSATGAINLAVLLGARRIVLLGIDGGPVGDKTWHHAPHAWAINPHAWELQRLDHDSTAQAALRLAVEIVNASPISRLSQWPKVNLEDEL